MEGKLLGTYIYWGSRYDYSVQKFVRILAFNACLKRIRWVLVPPPKEADEK